MPPRKKHPGSQLPIDTIELEELLGSDWADFRIAYVTGSGWQLFTPQWRRGFTAGELKQHFYEIMGVHRAQLAAASAAAAIEAAIEAQHAAEARADYYRRQLVLESRVGAMLCRVADE